MEPQAIGGHPAERNPALPPGGAAPHAAGPGPPAAAMALIRDGWLLLGLGFAALLLAAPAYWFSTQPGTGKEVSETAGALAFMLGLMCAVVTAFGLWKLWRAHRQGCQRVGLGWAACLVVFYLVLLAVLLESEAFSHLRYRRWFWAVPVAGVASFLLWRLRPWRRPKLDAAVQGLSLFALGQLWLLSVWGWPRLDADASGSPWEEVKDLLEAMQFGPGMRAMTRLQGEPPQPPVERLLTAAWLLLPWFVLTAWGGGRVLLSRSAKAHNGTPPTPPYTKGGEDNGRGTRVGGTDRLGGVDPLRHGRDRGLRGPAPAVAALHAAGGNGLHPCAGRWHGPGAVAVGDKAAKRAKRSAARGV